MADGKRFEVDIGWPVVVLVAIIVAVVVTAIEPQVWTLVTDNAIKVITALKGLF